jgi:hypothetical protein
MGSVAMIHIRNLIKAVSAIQKLIEGIQRHKQDGDRISLLIFLQNKESRLTARTFCGALIYSTQA